MCVCVSVCVCVCACVSVCVCDHKNFFYITLSIGWMTARAPCNIACGGGVGRWIRIYTGQSGCGHWEGLIGEGDI